MAGDPQIGTIPAMITHPPSSSEPIQLDDNRVRLVFAPILGVSVAAIAGRTAACIRSSRCSGRLWFLHSYFDCDLAR
jgi:hypothetical protein